MNIIAFHRVSTEEQVESGLGLEAQQSRIEELARGKGWKIVASYTEKGVSGKLALNKRPILMEAIAAASVMTASAIVVSRLDRLTRDPLTQLTIEKTLNASGIRLVSASGEGTESDDPGHVLMRRILSAVAENEAALVSLRTKAAFQAKKQRGERIGRPPYGFYVDGGILTPGRGYLNVLRILMARATGTTYSAIVEKMKEDNPEEGWSINKVYRICKRWKNRNAVVRRFGIPDMGQWGPTGRFGKQ